MSYDRDSNHKSQIVLALDPSSTVVGYAVLRSPGELVEAASILPNSRSDDSFHRCLVMSEELLGILDRIRPSVILIEWTKGKVNVHRHGGLGAGLAVYGCGVGWMAANAYAWTKLWPACEVHAVLENDWTRGVPKARRQLAVASAYPEYAAHLAEDSGGDIADAIGLADWWLREQVARGLFEGGRP